jgi:hypothetical protein
MGINRVYFALGILPSALHHRWLRPIAAKYYMAFRPSKRNSLQPNWCPSVSPRQSPSKLVKPGQSWSNLNKTMAVSFDAFLDVNNMKTVSPVELGRAKLS